MVDRTNPESIAFELNRVARSFLPLASTETLADLERLIPEYVDDDMRRIYKCLDSLVKTNRSITAEERFSISIENWFEVDFGSLAGFDDMAHLLEVIDRQCHGSIYIDALRAYIRDPKDAMMVKLAFSLE